MLSVLACGKPVSYTRAVRLLDPRRHTLYSLGDTPFVLVVSAPIPPAEAVCADVHEEVLERLLREAEREMRSRHLPERRKPWSPTKTKAPLADAAAKRARSPTLEDYLKVAEEVVEKLGDPWNPSRRGRKPLYSPKKLAAALIVKEFRGMSFETLSSELRKAGHDARTEEAKRKGDGAKSPCPSHLHWVLTKIPEEYPERALRLLDRMVAEKHARLFGTEHLHEYSVDSTEDRCDTLEEVEVAMETQLHHETVGVQRAHQACDQHRGGRQGLREHEGRETPPEARAAGLNGLHGPRSTTPGYNLRVRLKAGNHPRRAPQAPRRETVQGPPPPQGSQGVQPGEVRAPQALVERPIGNRAARDGGTLNYRRPDTRRKGLILKYIAHNMRAYSTQLAWQELLKPVRIP